MKKLALLLATTLALGAIALPAFAAEGASGEKADPALQAQLTYTPQKPDVAITAAEKKAALSAVAAESSPMAALIAFGMFGVVLVTVAGGVVAYRRA